AALFGLECVVYMGEEDVRRQALNVYRMRLLGAEVVSVASGTRTLKDATNEAIRDWVTNVRDTFYVLGSVVGPHPYPMLVRDLQSVIGFEVMDQLAEREGRSVPDVLVACVGGGGNAIGLFAPFAYLPAGERPRLVGVEAGGHGVESGRHAASITGGKTGVLHGSLMYLLSDDGGQVSPPHSVSAGLDYPGVGPEHSHLAQAGVAEYVAATDEEALDAFELLARVEGIVPALESAHAVAHAAKLAPTLPTEAVMVVGLSGRGDKDVAEVSRLRAGAAREGEVRARRGRGRATTGRVASASAAARAEGRAAFAAYLTAGFPDRDGFLRAAEEVLAQADLLEGGLPFSGPLGDGPTIQRASERALAGGVGGRETLELVARLRERTDKPLVVMSYYNPIYCHPGGEAGFAADLKAAGGDGVIL